MNLLQQVDTIALYLNIRYFDQSNVNALNTSELHLNFFFFNRDRHSTQNNISKQMFRVFIFKGAKENILLQN